MKPQHFQKHTNQFYDFVIDIKQNIRNQTFMGEDIEY